MSASPAGTLARLEGRAGLLLLAITALVYAPTLGAGFVWDDGPLIVENPLIAGGGSVADHFRSELWEPTPARESVTGYYRPLFTLSLALDHAIAGMAPAVFHAVSVAWHLVAVGLLYRLARRLGVSAAAAAVGAGVFALHPAQVETVAFVSARSELLAATALFGTLLLAGDPGPLRPGRLVAAAGLALAGMLCKETAVTAPVALAMWTAAAGRRVPAWAVAGPLLAVAGWWAMRASAGIELPASASSERLGAALAPTLAFYARSLIWPVGLIPGAHLEWPEPVPWGFLVPAGLLLGGLVFVGGRRALGSLGLGALWLAPSLGAVAAVGLVSDRYLYLPLAGLGLAVAVAVERAAPAVRAAAVAVPLSLGVGSFATLPAWADDLRFWLAAVERHPQPYTWSGMGEALEQVGRYDAAAEWYRKATQPPEPRQVTCFKLTALQLERGDPAGAVAEGERGLAAGCAPSPELLAPLALAYAAVGRWDDAESTAGEVGADPTGKAVVVRVAAAARRGDLQPLYTEGGDRVAALARQVAWLLDRAGEAEAAQRVRDAAP